MRQKCRNLAGDDQDDRNPPKKPENSGVTAAPSRSQRMNLTYFPRTRTKISER